MSPEPEPCPACSIPMAPDQRYCVGCGTRHGVPHVGPAPPGSRADAHQVSGTTAVAGASSLAVSVAATDAVVNTGRPAWGAPFADGRVQPVVPAVTALLAGLLIGVTGNSGTANSAPATGPYVVQLPPAPAATTISPVLPALGLLPPSVSTVVPSPAVLPEAPEPLVTASEPLEDTAPAEPAPEDDEPAPDDAPAGQEETPAGEPGAPSLSHVFLIVLSDQGEERTYGQNSPAPFLARSLTKRGVLLRNHFAVTRGGLPNTIAMLSGQGPTPQTQAGCPTYSDLLPTAPDAVSPGEDGQELGDGCVSSPVSGTILDQLRGNERDWAAHVQGMGPEACRRPAPGAPDETTAGRPGDLYATARNPPAYFHSIVDDAEGCAARDRDLNGLETVLKGPAAKVPDFVYVAPDPLHSGTDTAYAADQPAGGLAGADAFLKEWVPRIEASKAYRDGGLIVITTDQAPSPGDTTGTTGATGPSGPTGASGPTGPSEPSSGESCCLQPEYPNVPAGQPGGGRVGLLLLSPRLKDPGSVVEDPTNHFDLLRSLEDGYGLSPLGYAARSEVTGLPLASLLKPADG